MREFRRSSGSVGLAVVCGGLLLIVACAGVSSSAREKLAVADGATTTTALVNPEAPAVDAGGAPITDAQGVQMTRAQVVASGGTLPPAPTTTITGASPGVGPTTTTTRPPTTTTTTRPPTTTTTTRPPPNRRGVTSYDRIAPGAPHYGSFRSAWQPFVAQSNTITYLAATVGGGGGSSFLIRLTTAASDGCGAGVIAGGYAGINQYGESGIDIGDVAVNRGSTYYICYLTPNYPTINSWVTYWWAGGSTIASSDQMQAKVQGYNR